MSEIVMERTHTLDDALVRDRVRVLEQKLEDRYGVRLVWRGEVAEVRAPGVTGQLQLSRGQVRMQLRLGLMLRPLAGTIRQMMETQLERVLKEP